MISRYRPFHISSTVLLLVTLLIPMAALADGPPWSGSVVGISDGDTITVMHNGKDERIRLYGIDPPEKGQDFGQKAKAFTAGMMAGKVVTVVPMDTDRYGRTVGLVYVGAEATGQSVNEALVSSGLAWVYLLYCTRSFCDGWKSIQELARQARVGL